MRDVVGRRKRVGLVRQVRFDDAQNIVNSFTTKR
jgi:hypothetical protein